MECSLRRAVLVTLNGDPELGRETICRLGRTVASWAAASTAPSAELARAIGVTPASLERARELAAAAPARAAGLLDRARVLGLEVLAWGDDAYPRPLYDLELPPPVLYCRGSLPDGPAIAIVGSRAADAYGLEATSLFASALARAGLTVVSGFARGIDTAAHRAAIRDPAGRTVAVLGCGLDVDYPRGSLRLRAQVERQGALLSEFPPATPALPRHFPIRNRIIAALGCACLVVQAAPRSGSLITVRYATEVGRDVWAVPGRIFDSRSAGTNLLIRDGASPALSPEHLLEALPREAKEALARKADPEAAAGATAPPASGAGESSRTSSLAQRLLGLLTPGEPTSAERLAQRSRAGVSEVLAALLDLELDGAVSRVAGSRYVRRAAPVR